MSRSILRAASAGMLIAGVVVACGGTPGTTGIPSVPPINVPSVSIPSIPPLPSGILPSFAIPSFPPDPVLEQAFPAQIDGQPVTDVESANFLAFVQSFATPEQVQQFVAGMHSIGVDPAAVGFASGTATVDGSTVEIQLIRFPGGDPRAALDILIRIDEPTTPPTLTTETIGGKSVTVATTDGDREYYYLSGDMAWFLGSAEQSEAEVIFAALP